MPGVFIIIILLIVADSYIGSAAFFLGIPMIFMIWGFIDTLEGDADFGVNRLDDDDTRPS